MSELELISVVHKQGLKDFSEVQVCALEPNGTFYVEAKKPSLEETHISALQEAVGVADARGEGDAGPVGEQLSGRG